MYCDIGMSGVHAHSLAQPDPFVMGGLPIGDHKHPYGVGAL